MNKWYYKVWIRFIHEFLIWPWRPLHSGTHSSYSHLNKTGPVKISSCGCWQVHTPVNNLLPTLIETTLIKPGGTCMHECHNFTCWEKEIFQQKRWGSREGNWDENDKISLYTCMKLSKKKSLQAEMELGYSTCLDTGGPTERKGGKDHDILKLWRNQWTWPLVWKAPTWVMLLNLPSQQWLPNYRKWVQLDLNSQRSYARQ